MNRTSLPGVEGANVSRATQAALFAGVAVTLAVLARMASFDFINRNPLFHPHGYCYLWDTPLVSAHVVSDVIIGVSYVAISLTLAYLVFRARRDIPFGWMVLTFGAFIVACGMTHFMEVVTLWQPVFWLSADVKIVTAIASVGAAVLLPPLVPKVFKLIESAKISEERRLRLAEANEALESRVAERTSQLEAAFGREQELRMRAEVASRTKDEFLATVSHELRTPLNAILGWVDMLRRGTLSNDAVERALASIQRNARVQATLVEDLLDISRITSGTLVLEGEPVSLRRVVGDALDTVRLAADSRHLTMTCTIPDAPIWVAGDARRLQQIVWNLLSNAVKFTHEGGKISIDATVDGSDVRLSVTDDGIGIDPGFMPHVFERFRQADSSTRRPYPGLGLGLALVRHLAELHGGTVDARSEGLGRGATFTVRLPLLRESMEHMQIAIRPKPERKLPELQGVRVLAVDDDHDSLEMVAEALRGCGAFVATQSSSAAAFGRAVEVPFDVIVSDIAMPDVDGFELIRRLRETGVRTPAIALTAHARVGDQARALAAGFRGYVSKPATALEIAWAVKAAMQSSDAAPWP